MTHSRGRLIFIIATLIGLTLLVVVQLVRYQLVLHQPADSGRLTPVQSVPAQRGWIYDRNGYVLAGSEPRYAVFIDKSSANLQAPARDLPPMIGLTPEKYWELVNTKDLVEVPLARDLPPEVITRIRDKNFRGVLTRAYWKRTYPEGSLAAHVLGFVNDERTGFYGLEGQYNDLLNGTTISTTEVSQVRPGADLVLTIDRTVQGVAEEELARGLQDTGAESGTIIVMQPKTGEILALAVAPGFDPNTYQSLITKEPKRFIDQAVSDQYEPGSTFKIFTLAAALDQGLVTPQSTYNDTAYIEIGGQLIFNWDRAAHGTVDMVEMMARSLNVGAATLAMQMGQQNFYRYLRAFGIGRRTGIDLQNEAPGMLRTRDDNPGTVDGQPGWSEGDLGTNAFGQGVSSTPIQMITAVAAVANDGLMVQPHVVKEIVGTDRTIEARVVPIGRPIKAETARTLTNILVQVVDREVPFAQVKGYRIAGKTGTAQIPVPGGYDEEKTIASFIGYGPADNPQLIILVKLDKPSSSPWGSETAAPVFQRVATRLFALLDIKPDDVQLAAGRGQ